LIFLANFENNQQLAMLKLNDPIETQSSENEVTDDDNDHDRIRSCRSQVDFEHYLPSKLTYF
jgi:hypothetical protein